jgi:serine/threonine-protein kinase
VHPHIVQVHNLGRYRGLYFVVMEYLHGKTLHEYRHTCLKFGCLPPSDFSAFIVSRICRGLEYAHTKRDRHGAYLNIVHRDVTPSNIMMDFRGAVKLTDFGIAKALTMLMPDEAKCVMGKLSYMSPEQAHSQATDRRSDIYSLGLVLHELLTGHRVFHAKTLQDLLVEMQRSIPDPRSQTPGLPERLCQICMQALAGSPVLRFQSAGEFGEALEEYLYGSGYGPTNEKLAKHLLELWPEADRDTIQ